MDKAKRDKHLERLFYRASKSWNSNQLTNELYQHIIGECNIIAHTDKHGFYQHHFGTLANFDKFIHILSKKIKFQLGDNEVHHCEIISLCRFRIASIEASNLKQSIKVKEHHLKELQIKFNWEL